MMDRSRPGNVGTPRVSNKSLRESGNGWHGGGDSGKLSFLESAKHGLPHPAQHENDDLPADLCEAVRFAVSKGPCITEWRDRAVARIDAAAADLWDLSERMIAESPAHVRHLVAATRKFVGAEAT